MSMHQTVLRLLFVAVLMAQAGCLSPMRDYEGHRVFNPLFLFYLESDARAQWQMPEQVLDALALQPGDTVADIGAGGGYFMERLAARVGPTGHVFATDVQEVLLKKLRQRVARQSLTNVTVVRGAFDHPNLPAAACDWVFLSSVYKEIDGRVAYMRQVRAILKPLGRVAILEYRPDTEAPGPPLPDRLPESQVMAELRQAGFVLLARHDFLPREYFLVFGIPGI